MTFIPFEFYYYSLINGDAELVQSVDIKIILFTTYR